jgi:VanZ family protein
VQAPRWYLALLTLAVGAILVATLAPGDPDAPALACTTCAASLLANAVANVLLYLPLGVATALLGWGLGLALVLGAALSATIESLQLVIPGRNSAPLDVLTNTVGTAVGYFVALRARWWLRPTSPASGWLALGSALAFLSVCALTILLLQPVATGSLYHAQWTTRVPGLAVYEGRLLDATLDDIALPQGRITEPARVRELLRDGATLTVVFVAGPPPSELAPVFGLSDSEYRQLITISADEEDLVFGYLSRAATLRLNQPETRLAGALRGIAPGDEVTVLADLRSPVRCLTVNAVRMCDRPSLLGSGWALVAAPDHFPPWTYRGMSLAWLAVLAFPFGLWVRKDLPSVAGGLVILATLSVLPLWAATPVPDVTDILGVAAGIAGGGLVRRAVRSAFETVRPAQAVARPHR